SHDTTTAKYVATVETGIEHGTVELSKTSEIAYGEEITVTATPAEGYALEKLVVVNAQGTETDITELKKFNATCVNVVKATFAVPTPATPLENALTYDLSSIPNDTSGTAYDAAKLLDKLNGMSEGSIAEISAIEKVYGGNSAQGPKKTGLKVGAGSAAGTFTAKLANDKSWSKITLKGFAWSATKLAKVTVNGKELSFVADDATAERTMEFVLNEPATTFTISASIYCVFTSLVIA
ncbi:MAG: hypothetical protein IJS52_01325, partial [Bacilli bacterium]|nr:hypothetical protein [Bacilli bacterium]